MFPNYEKLKGDPFPYMMRTEWISDGAFRRSSSIEIVRVVMIALEDQDPVQF